METTETTSLYFSEWEPTGEMNEGVTKYES